MWRAHLEELLQLLISQRGSTFSNGASKQDIHNPDKWEIGSPLEQPRDCGCGR